MTPAPPLPSTNVQQLSRLIALPQRPVAAIWQHTSRGSGGPSFGPDDYALTAVLTFRPQDMQRVVAASLRRAPAKTGEVEVQPWFPAALKKLAVRSGNGKPVVKGQRLDAGDFYKMSLSHGFLLRVGQTPHAVLFLYTT